MAPKLGSKKSPTLHNCREDGLAWEVVRYIYIDLESGEFDPEKPAVIASSRPSVYGDPKNWSLRKAVKDKIRSVRALKSQDEGRYLYVCVYCNSSFANNCSENLGAARESVARSPHKASSIETPDRENSQAKTSAAETKESSLFSATSASEENTVARRLTFDSGSFARSKLQTMSEIEYDCTCANDWNSDSHLPLLTDKHTVEGADVPENCIVPGLFVMRLLDEPDKKNRLHHTYQFKFVGDLEAAAEVVSCQLIDHKTVLITLPKATGGLLNELKKSQRQLADKGKITQAGIRAQATLIDTYTQHPDDEALFKVLVEFKTGEKLTNRVWGETAEDFGMVNTLSTITEREFQFHGKKYSSTEVMALWNIARVEEKERFGDVRKRNTKRANRTIADDLAQDVAGMGVE